MPPTKNTSNPADDGATGPPVGVLDEWNDAAKRVLGERYDTVEKYVRFAFIGAFGAITNTLLLYLITEFLGIHYLVSAAIATECTIIMVFFLNNQFTFDNTKGGTRQLLDGIVRSNLVRIVGISVQLSLLFALTEFLGLYYIVSNILAIFVASIFNFLGEKQFNWQE